MKKRTFFSLLFVTILLLSLIFSVVGNAVVANQKYFKDLESYHEYLSGKTVSENFVWYEDLSFLGSFEYFNGFLYGWQPSGDFQTYEIRFRNDFGSIIFYCDRYSGKTPPSDVYNYLEGLHKNNYTPIEYKEGEDLRFSRRGAVSKQVDDLLFCYSSGKLCGIVWQQSFNSWCRLWILPDTDVYSLNITNIIYQLCQSETMKSAKEKLFQATRTNVEQNSTEDSSAGDFVATTDTASAITDALPEPEPTVKWWHTALPVGGGIAVVGSLAAVLLLRKKKK